MTIGAPISFSVGIASVVATLLLPGVDNATIVQRMLTSLNTFPLLAVIFFAAGTLMARGGVAIRLRMAEVLVGWLPGSSRRSSSWLDVLRRGYRFGGGRGLSIGA
jgi:C4-dicarboxylate transporter DctM subunit